MKQANDKYEKKRKRLKKSPREFKPIDSGQDKFYQDMIKKKMTDFAKRKLVRKFDTKKMIEENNNNGMQVE